jgi:hypothetical protein
MEYPQFKKDIPPPQPALLSLNSRKESVNHARYIYDNAPPGTYVEYPFAIGSDIAISLKNVIAKEIYNEWKRGGIIKKFVFRKDGNTMRIWRI